MNLRKSLPASALLALLIAGCSTFPQGGNNSKDPTINSAGISLAAVSQGKIEAEATTKSGSYACNVNTPLNGVGLFGSSDVCYTNFNFATIPGQYRIDVRGQSSTATPAVATVYVGGSKVGTASFSNTANTVSITFDLPSTPNSKEVRISGELDTGVWDLYIDWFEVFYLGAIPAPPPAPTPPSSSVWASGTYRNLFKEWGKTDAEINTKVYTAVSNFFGYGDQNLKCYYTSGSDKAYIFTADTSDVRSEGMSYGMMIAVQMGMKPEFDKLWNWAKTYMQHQSGDRVGYFAWQCGTSGNMMDQNPAPDGEEYFAMSLYFAWKRWGNGTGIYNYKAEADNILNHMLHQDQFAGQYSGVTKMIDSATKQVVFTPYGSSANFTDPSYHLPGFYELFARWAAADGSYWSQVAAASRAFWKTACNSTTGLFPDYAEFTGTPNNTGSHGDFRFDAWRVIQNIAIDYYWWKLDSWEATQVDKIQDFFNSKGVTSYGNQWSLSGSQLSGDHSPGLVAMNAVGALVASKQQAWDFVKNLWDITPTSGQYRYYDGCLYVMGLINVAGKYQIWGRDGSTVSSSSSTAQSSSTAVSSSSKSSSSSSAAVSSSSAISSVQSSAVSSTASSAASTSGATLNPYNQVEAESFNGQSGVTTASGDGGTVITYTANGYAYFNNVDFGTSGAVSVQVRAKDPASGANVTFYLDSPTGTQIATVYPNGGGTWNTAQNTCYPVPTGKHTVYMKVNNANVQINWFKFIASGTSSTSSVSSAVSSVASSSSAVSSAQSSAVSSAASSAASSTAGTISPFSQMEAESYSGQSGATTASGDGGTVVTFSANGNYIYFNNVDFGTSGASSVQVRAKDPGYGLNVTFYLDSPTGTQIATVYPSGGNTWNTANNTCYPKPTGKHAVYVKVNTANAQINWIKFVP